ncbi:DUF4272 domain-containing protein [Corynebacterium alimapuense]|uniref:Uncharacterized protein n=1 Tax=Corynebacterium alimapuense TaxID=1576874 RepID=A0A3M8KBP9_9CORY|nr:DUF4272 domain-containing protein [Corynebacterium alimapuense]RNE49952.1 hypothetical protein C5L39_00825 [Corynebacterium alimapuense]
MVAFARFAASATFFLCRLASEPSSGLIGDMDVLVFSTVPIVSPVGASVTAWEEAIYEPAEIADLRILALQDLAEAGLKINDASVTRSHPLARLISRAVVVYRFRREESYSARQLGEFADWAEELNCVFRIGNGPFRNLDGESLLAPGREVKVPVHPEARNRRLRNLRSLRQAGYELNEELPVVVGDAELILRDPVEVSYRLCALSLVAASAGFITQGNFPPVEQWGPELELVEHSLNPRERSFLDDVWKAWRISVSGSGIVAPSPVPSPALIAEAATFHAESFAVEVLAWVLGQVEVAPSRLRAWDFDAEMWKVGDLEALPRCIVNDGCAVLLLQEQVLREPAVIIEAFDLAHVLHHTIEAGDRLWRQRPDWAEGNLPTIARAWTRALSWLCSPNSVWGQAERLL